MATVLQSPWARPAQAGSIPPEPAPGGPPPGRGRRWLARHAPALGFLARFALLLAAFQGVVLLPWADRAYDGCLCANASVAGAVLRGFGEDVHVSGVMIRTAGYAVAIRRGCDAIEPAWFFCAAVLAYPLSWRRKWPGLLAGTAVLFAVNLLRIVSLYFIGRRIPRLFPSAHLEWWPAAFILAAIALWLAWVGWARGRPPADEKV